MRVHVVAVPFIPHSGRIYIDGADLATGGQDIFVWVVEWFLGDEDNRRHLERHLNQWISDWFDPSADSP
ncbi:hypothetical protein STBA_38400 [Streptomyces sp. MP131-18]|nr:hypothetical protein STBA_38400 [Streptomyces sp. MP131-18]